MPLLATDGSCVSLEWAPSSGKLAKHQIDGMAPLLTSFEALVATMRAKPYRLLDFTQVAFDADKREFDGAISALETALQAFINRSFETITSTDTAYSLLRRYQEILQRPSLREDLDAKLRVIFSNYGLDLEATQTM